jgi:hypothetical protein
MPQQHRTHGNVDGTAGPGARDHFAFQILDALNPAIPKDKELVAEVICHSILYQISYYPQVFQSGILNS